MIKHPELIPFRAEHLQGFIPRDDDYYESLFTAMKKQVDGPAFSAVVGKVILGCAGIQLLWPGMGVAWAVFSKDLLIGYPFWTTRIVKRYLQDIMLYCNLHRVEMVALADSEDNNKWAKALGFKLESPGTIVRRYTAFDASVIRYEIVREG